MFNLCLAFLPLAGAMAFTIIARDHLYAYEYSEAGARAVRARVERLNGELIRLDYDRYRQWDDLVAMELMAGDVSAARGFLLSARGMLPPRAANQIERAAGSGDDAALEVAALDLLTPGTRSRYETTVPLLSRRAASGAAQRRDPDGALVLVGDERDFEMLARALILDPQSDALQFLLTGLSLDLAGEFTPRMQRGAAALLAASRREDFPPGVASDVAALVAAALPPNAFRAGAQANAGNSEASDFVHSAPAFRDALTPARVEAFVAVLDQIGEAAEASSLSAAASLLTHANSLADLPRLKLLAQSSGDRAAAAAKRLPRDGRLLAAARGELTMTRELVMTLAAAGAAAALMLLVIGFMLYRLGRRAWLHWRDDEYGGELVDLSSEIGESNWRPL